MGPIVLWKRFCLLYAMGTPQDQFSGFTYNKNSLHKAGCLSVCRDASLTHHKESVSKAIVLPSILTALWGLPSYWQVMSYFQVMCNHSSSAFFLISTPERGRHTNTVSFLRHRAFVLQMVYVVSRKEFNEGASPSLSNGQNFMDWKCFAFLPLLWECHWPFRKAIHTFTLVLQTLWNNRCTWDCLSVLMFAIVDKAISQSTDML